MNGLPQRRKDAKKIKSRMADPIPIDLESPVTTVNRVTAFYMYLFCRPLRLCAFPASSCNENGLPQRRKDAKKIKSRMADPIPIDLESPVTTVNRVTAFYMYLFCRPLRLCAFPASSCNENGLPQRRKDAKKIKSRMADPIPIDLESPVTTVNRVTAFYMYLFCRPLRLCAFPASSCNENGLPQRRKDTKKIKSRMGDPIPIDLESPVTTVNRVAAFYMYLFCPSFASLRLCGQGWIR